MIKNINDGEMDKLKEGFYNTLALKKLNYSNFKEFMNDKLDFNLAIKLCKYLDSYKFPSYYDYFNGLMLQYFVTHKWIDEEDFKTIKKVFDNLSESDYNYGDYSMERYDLVMKLVKKICLDHKIEFITETYEDIFMSDINYIDIEIFGEIRNMLRSYADFEEGTENLSIDEWHEKYYEIFQDNATCFVLKNFVMEDNEVMHMMDTFSRVSEGIQSEVFSSNGNTYIVISDMQMSEGLGYDFLILLKVILISRN